MQSSNVSIEREKVYLCFRPEELLYFVQLHLVQMAECQVMLQIVLDAQLFAFFEKAETWHEIVLLRTVLRHQ